LLKKDSVKYVTDAEPEVVLHAPAIELEAVMTPTKRVMESAMTMQANTTKQMFEVEGGAKTLSEMLQVNATQPEKEIADLLAEAVEDGSLYSPTPQATHVQLADPPVDYFNTTGIAETLDGLMPGRDHTASEDNSGGLRVTFLSMFNSVEGAIVLVLLFIVGQTRKWEIIAMKVW